MVVEEYLKAGDFQIRYEDTIQRFHLVPLKGSPFWTDGRFLEKLLGTDTAQILEKMERQRNKGRRGRPPKENTMDKALILNVYPEMYEKLQQRADEAGQTVSSYVRELLQKELSDQGIK